MEFLNELQTAAFWTGLLAIIWVNIILSGDNAVVIALAARSLPARQQTQAVIWGAGAAVVLRIILTIVAVELLKLPWLKLIGGALLLWIAVKLLWTTIWHAIVVWGMMAPVFVGLVYAILLPLLRRALRHELDPEGGVD